MENNGQLKIIIKVINAKHLNRFNIVNIHLFYLNLILLFLGYPLLSFFVII